MQHRSRAKSSQVNSVFIKELFVYLPGDIVLVAGKGHEDYQIIGREKIHFDDVEEVEKAFDGGKA